MTADLLQRLIEAGTPAALVAEVAMELAKASAQVEVLEAKASELESRRKGDRERKAKSRDNASGHVTSRDNAEVTGQGVTVLSPLSSPPKAPVPPNTPPIIPPLFDLSGCSKKRGHKAEKPKPNYTGDFLTFWDEYPRTAGTSKADAFAVFQRLGADDQAAAIEGAIIYAERCRSSNTAEQYMCHASVFLNQRRWETLVEAAE